MGLGRKGPSNPFIVVEQNFKILRANTNQHNTINLKRGGYRHVNTTQTRNGFNEFNLLLN